MRKLILCAIIAMASISAFAQNKGFEKAVEATGGIGLDKYQKFSFGVNFVGGYRINDYFFVGAGAGYEYLDGLYYTSYEYHSGAGNSYHGTSDDVRNNIKVFGRLKANLTATKVSPFFPWIWAPISVSVPMRSRWPMASTLNLASAATLP